MGITDTTCVRCGSSKGVQLESSRTAYSSPLYTLWTALIYDDSLPDLNAPVLLCRDCAKEHHEFWDEQWNEYYYARL